MKKTSTKNNKAIFFDRDGVINKKPNEHDYVKNWNEFEFLPDVTKIIKKLSKDFLIIIVSNQRGVAREIMTKQDVEDIHRRMIKSLEDEGAKIDGVYFCPHDHEDNCDCRKPNPGLLLKAAEDFKIDLSRSYMIGDDLSDVQAGTYAGCKTILINRGEVVLDNEEISPDYIVSELSEVINII